MHYASQSRCPTGRPSRAKPSCIPTTSLARALPELSCRRPAAAAAGNWIILKLQVPYERDIKDLKHKMRYFSNSRYERDIKDLKQELAMHDTLAGRGRIKYDDFSADEVRDGKMEYESEDSESDIIGGFWMFTGLRLSCY
jgi:hypothetical protein